MAKKNLSEKILDVFFWTSIFLVMYLIVGFLLGSSWLSKGLTFKEAYDLFKDALSITAAFLAPIAAFILFSDWREQHNKQVKNEFALKAFNQFEKFERGIEQAGFILTELEDLLPQESEYGSDRIPLYLDDPIFEINKDLILSFPKQIQVVQEEFSSLLDKLRNFAVVIDQMEEITPFVKYLINEFEQIHDKENDNYGEYLQLLMLYDEKLQGYMNLRNHISNFISINILQQLKA